MEHTSPKHEKTKPRGIPLYIDNAIIAIWGIFFLLFPFFFSTLTTDAFILPRQLFLLAIAIVSLMLLGTKMLAEGKTKLRRTPFDLPLFLFTLFIFLSAIFSINRIDSLTAFVPFLFLVLSFVILINSIRTEGAILFLLSMLAIGGAASGLLEIFSFFKVYILPMSFTHAQSFNPFGSLVEQGYYFLLLLPITIYLAYPIIKGNLTGKSITFTITSIFLLGGLITTLIQLLTTQQPIFLPFETGFQTAFASISQDATRIAQGFFFGSGYGTFATDFTRFKQAPFNLNTNIWYLTFNQSSSFILELLATTGFLGIVSFLFIIWRVVKNSTMHAKGYNPLFLSLLIFIVASFFLPFSFLTISLFFFLLSLFVSIQALLKPKEFFDIEVHLIALKKGLFFMQTEDKAKDNERGFTKFIPITMFILFLLLSIYFGYFGTRYAMSDITFQKSLVAASKNNGTETYNYEKAAIDLFPYRDFYYRIFSQTNLALANSLVQTKKNELAKDPQAQQTLYKLIQQSIDTGRNATAISPMTVANWQNLASVYRALIGFGQNAESFSLQATQQAVALDTANPQESIALGGLYYQLGQYDNAIRQFQTAYALKADFANAYYNLGHALEQKGDLKNALAQYQTAQTLVTKDPNASKQITAEINALQDKIAKVEKNTNQPVITPIATPTEMPTTTEQKQTQLPLDLNQNTTLPTQKPKIKIPGPTIPIVPTAMEHH